MQQNELANILGEALGSDPAGKPMDPARRVDEHFRTIHDFVVSRDANSPSPLELVIQKIDKLYQNFNAVASSANPGQAMMTQLATAGGGGGAAGGGGGGSPTAQLQALARDPSVPKPVAAMLAGVSASSARVTATGASHELSDAWSTKILPLCEAAFKRYPIIAGSASDVPVDDFSRLFGPGGMMDKFFAENLKPFVDTAHRPWRWLTADQTPLGLSPDSLVNFERAAQIRDGLFTPAGKVQVGFQLVPVNLDPSVARITIDMGGQTMVWDHGPQEQARFQWPGTDGKTLVRVTMTPASGGQGQVVEKDGPWALLRLLDTAKISPSPQPDKFRIVFNGGGGAASFELNANSVNNPFTLAALRNFRCPTKL